MLNYTVPLSHFKYYILVLALMCAVILSALAFEHIGGYIPCQLCLQQREPWYLGMPVMGIACASLLLKGPACLTRGMLAIGGVIMVYSFVLGVHHSGVEWGFWKGPGDCGVVEGGLANTTTDLLRQLEQTVAPSCTDAALRILGLSFAGWNAVASLIIAVVAFRTVAAR